MELPPLLTKTEAEHLAVLIQAGRRPGASRRTVAAGKRAENEYILGNLRLVYSVANRFQRIASLDLEDLVQEGTVGLIHALSKFDWGRGTKFSTYAIPWINHYITRAIANQSRIIRLPVNVDEEVLKLSRTRARLDVQLGRTATDEEVAEAMETTAEHVRQLDGYNQPLLSLSAPEDGDLDVPDTRVEDEIPQDDLGVSELMERTLTPGEQAVMTMKYGLGDGPQLDKVEMAKVLDITKAGVEMREKRAMRKLRLAVAA